MGETAARAMAAAFSKTSRSRVLPSKADSASRLGHHRGPHAPPGQMGILDYPIFRNMQGRRQADQGDGQGLLGRVSVTMKIDIRLLSDPDSGQDSPGASKVFLGP